jgi:ribonuclease P protein component
LVAHLLVTSADTPGQAGFVVGRAVGPAVTRNRVRRRLRHLVAARLDRLPTGSLLVIRATPAAATASSADLGTALDRLLDRVAPVLA